MKNDRLMISGPAFALVVQTVLEKGVTARFKVTGSSMIPTIKSNDVVSISPYKKNTPEVGEVVALLDRANSRIIIHRIIEKRKNMFLLKGDGLWRYDGFFPREWIAGFVSRIERKHVVVSDRSVKSDRHVLMSKLRLFWLLRIICYVKRNLLNIGIIFACYFVGL